ncbi:DNA-binding SARP family transcriptional activator [Murinocardiopsis flavida]|uniref:DNA-binding SARP family transcriptional activator n=1 Tax=Murinocardiopsis flavida TaxID=645275 RepID=A0A2P8CF07_9ACTN|nr:AfsR/SARP family transcriptional regulator [Murinocardiopsis flavida]PSK83555.1 DNA-binding SARP family transcriptional activator [Murinocardiopsis flavida]
MKFGILGEIEVRNSGKAVPLGGVKRKRVLASLLLSANKTVSMERLTQNVWDEHLPENERTSLQMHVSRLRRIIANAPGVSIEATDAGYQLLIPRNSLDLEEFRRIVVDAKTTEAPSGALEKLREARRLWRDYPLSGIASNSLSQRTVGLVEEYWEAVEMCVQIELDLGMYNKVIAEIPHFVHVSPFRERLSDLWMTALHHSGQRAAALDVYRATQNRLQRELGVAPGPQLQRRNAAVLNNDLTQ